MVRKIFFIAAVQLSFIFCLNGQSQDVREQAYLHLNTSSLLTGETLYFSGFVTSTATGKPSHLSKILYVELIGPDSKPLFQKKVRLQNGRGHGAFFVSSLVPTGRYQLIAYTRWMKNFRDYFQAPITVVNPFEEYQAPDQQQPMHPVIAFYPEGGTLVQEVQNKVVFEVVPHHITGKIVTDAGENVAEIHPDPEGVGRFTITPEPGRSYKAILEDEQGEFYFYDLPKSTAGVELIQLKRENQNLQFRVVSSTSEEMALNISDGQNTVVAREIFTNSPVSVRTKDWRPGIYRASAIDPFGREIAFRLFHHWGAYEIREESLGRSFATRSLVQVPVEVDQLSQVSVSVRKADRFGKGPGAVEVSLYNNISGPDYEQQLQTHWETIDNQMITSSWKPEKVSDTVHLLPDLRGEIISGTARSASGQPIQNQFVAYSISGADYQVQVAKTDEEGNFVIQIQPVEGDHVAYLSLLKGDTAASFSLDKPFLDQYPKFDYTLPILDSATIAQLVKRSVRNQIENAYYEVRKDSILPESIRKPQFGNFDSFYFMDDYNRFPEMHEHFIEYIPTVVARKNKNRSKVKVLPKFAVPGQEDPLILIDGVPTSPDQILEFNPYKIESIGVINNRFFLGPLVSDGVISFHTFEKNLQGFPVGENTRKIYHQGLDPVRVYEFPDYGEARETMERIPDYRDQLYWNPLISIEPEKPFLLEFYTSDNTGDFEIAIEGFTSEGQAITIKKYFSVSETDQNN